VVAPVVGPTLGGYLADNYSWHWCFLINGPIGVVAIALIALLLREAAAAVEEQRRRLLEAGGFDLVGFGLQWQGIRLLHADRSGTLWRVNAEAGPRNTPESQQTALTFDEIMPASVIAAAIPDGVSEEPWRFESKTTR